MSKNSISGYKPQQCASCFRRGQNLQQLLQLVLLQLEYTLKIIIADYVLAQKSQNQNNILILGTKRCSMTTDIIVNDLLTYRCHCCWCICPDHICRGWCTHFYPDIMVFKQVEIGVRLTIVWNLLHILEGPQLFDILNQGSSPQRYYSQLPSSGSGQRAYTSCNSNSLICILYTQPHRQQLATCTLHTSAVLFRLCIFLSLWAKLLHE